MKHYDYVKQLRKPEKDTKWPEIEFDQELTLHFDDNSEMEIDTNSVLKDQQVAV